MSQITRLPWGLQKFLGSQNQGDNPSDLAQVVAPTLDMGEFFSVETEKWFTQTQSAFSSPTTQSITVPDGEIWLVNGWSAKISQTVPGAGDYVMVDMRWIDLANSNDGGSATGISPRIKVENNTGVASILNAAYWFPRPLIAWPGTDIQVRYDDFVLTAGNWAVKSSVNYKRLQI